jgi:hypothetical protein
MRYQVFTAGDAIVLTHSQNRVWPCFSSVLNSTRAVRVNIAIMRAFVKLREILATHRELSQRLKELEGKFHTHDAQIQEVFDAIRALLQPAPESSKRRIGFPR